MLKKFILLSFALFTSFASFTVVPSAFAISMVECSDGEEYPSPYDHVVDLRANHMATHQDLQSAVDDAQDGDIIAVCPGVYEGYVEINGKDIQLYGLGEIGAVILTNPNGIAPIMAALSIMNQSVVTLSNIAFHNTQYGLSVSFSDLTVYNGHFTGNDTALWIYRGSTVQVVSCVFKNNEANSVGGAAIKAFGTAVDPTVLRVNESSFAENTAHGDGGAILLLGDAAHYANTERSAGITAQIINSDFTDDFASRGGSISAQYARVQLSHLTINSSSASMRGGALHVQASVFAGNDLILSQNTANEGGALYIGAPTSATHLVNSSFANNVSTDTLGISGGGIDFYLPSTSSFKLRMSGVSFLDNSPLNCSGAAIRDLGNNFSSDATCF